jgi:hypothetical protein
VRILPAVAFGEVKGVYKANRLTPGTATSVPEVTEVKNA